MYIDDDEHCTVFHYNLYIILIPIFRVKKKTPQQWKELVQVCRAKGRRANMSRAETARTDTQWQLMARTWVALKWTRQSGTRERGRALVDLNLPEQLGYSTI